jgi:glycosyltransferase involved in cell wall biosynthesis
MNKVAIVVQRCYESVVGGSESHAWQYANLLKKYYDIDILTTTAIDIKNWDNILNEGNEFKDGICIRRFNVTQGRTIYWHKLHEILLKEINPIKAKKCGKSDKHLLIEWTTGLQEEFIRKQGPYSANLIKFLKERSGDYIAVIFFTYLYPTTYFGTFYVPKYKSFLVPTLHDEPPAYLCVYKYMMHRVRKLFWNTEAEREFGNALYGKLQGRIVGMAIETKKYAPAKMNYPYLLYCGRIDKHKGCDQLIKYFLKYKKSCPSELRLILTGKDEIGVTPDSNIDYKGCVSEKEKFKLMAGASVLVAPSPYESLSVVTLEAMAQSTSVVVNGVCKVLVEHVEKSKGGMIYRDYSSFVNAINSLLRNKEKCVKMGEKARSYVKSKYSFKRIEQILIEEIEKI